MRTKLLFLMSALACGAMAASCGNDDDGVALTGLRVSPETITKPVGETQQVTVTKVPDDAGNVTYTWTSSNEAVATVSNAGLVTITGIGAATVKVASGDISKEVPVTGTAKSLTVTDADSSSAGTYPFADEDIVFTLTAAVDPAGTALTWAVDVQTVTVTPSADGLTATVTIKAKGTATVTVTGGNLTATYVISTQSI
ncbi:MAG: Ig-like domain-containing protein, partial [Prevotellaceae bacterium]|nr:Ig-like domain-containing protein [Prevotellaceae bacterium]